MKSFYHLYLIRHIPELTSPVTNSIMIHSVTTDSYDSSIWKIFRFILESSSVRERRMTKVYMGRKMGDQIIVQPTQNVKVGHLFKT